MAAPSWRISGSRGPGLGGGPGCQTSGLSTYRHARRIQLMPAPRSRSRRSLRRAALSRSFPLITTSFASRSTSTCWTPGTALTSARRRCLPRGRHTRRRRNLRDRRRGRRQRLASEAGATAGFWRRVWSVYGAQRSQPVATGGKWASRGDGSNTRKALPWVATSCRDPKMVRRGSSIVSRDLGSRLAFRGLARERERASTTCAPLILQGIDHPWRDV